MIAQTVEELRTRMPPEGVRILAEPVFAIGASGPERQRRARLRGRERELGRLMTLVDRAPEAGSALLIRGAPGAGKSALVEALVAELEDRPVAVLRASGIRTEANLPYAGLHQLLRPLMGALGSLPRHQRRAIEAAFGIAPAAAPDPFLIAIATLDLLSMAARPGLVVVVEDAHWLDRPTSEVLSFVARRVASDRIVILVTARDDRRSPVLEAALAELHLEGPIDDGAGQIMTAVAPDITAPAPERVIGLADGNSQLLAVQAWNDIHLGRWTEAGTAIEAAAGLANEPGQGIRSVAADVADGLLGAMRGDEEQVERALARVGPAAIDRELGWVGPAVDIVRGINELSAGRPDLAFAQLKARIDSSPLAAWAIDQLADAAVLSGRVAEGREVFEAVSGEVDGSDEPLQEAALTYAGAVLADEATADERQRLAIDALADWPIHQARLQLHRGAWLRRHRRISDSRAPLRAARDLFEAVGAAPLAERARRELRASGERVRRREVTAWDQLSPQESEIAHLAAEGLSNREIGEQLFLSHRTVGAHLYRIFPKLGVTSRGQLHRVLATFDPRAQGPQLDAGHGSAYSV